MPVGTRCKFAPDGEVDKLTSLVQKNSHKQSIIEIT